MSTTNGNGTAHRPRRLSTQTQALLERYQGWDDYWGCSDLWRETRSGYWDTPPSTPSNRRGGVEWPIWCSEQDLGRLRQKGRIVCTTNPYAKGLLSNLITHIVGKGFSYKVQSKENTPDSDPAKEQRAAALKALIAKTQDELDRFLRRNRWNGTPDRRATIGQTREHEILRRVLRDGEAFLRYYEADGQLTVRFLEPEQIRDPAGVAQADGWSLGIQCDVHDVETVQAYHVEWIDPTTVNLADKSPLEGETVPADQVEHIKGPDTDSTIRRGVSAFAFGVAAALERARVLERNTSVAGAAKAAIAETWKHLYGTKAEVEEFRNLNREYQDTRTKADGGTATENVELRHPGMIRDIPDGMEPVYPAPDNSAAFLQVVQADLRAACAAFAAPEYFTADASNGNYACNSADTEILTRAGWKRYDELLHTDEVGTMNPDTHMLEYQRADHVYVYDHVGSMIRLQGSHNLDVLVTGNHRLWVTRQVHARVGGGKLERTGDVHPWQFIQAHELLETRSPWIMPFTVSGCVGEHPETFTLPGCGHKRTWRNDHVLNDRVLPIVPWLQFLGFWVSEGWVTKEPKQRGCYRIGLSQRPGVVADRIRATLAQLPGLRFKERLQKDGMISWTAQDRGLHHWLTQHAGQGAAQKKLPEFVYSLDSELLGELLESLIDGDGSRRPNGSVRYHTISKALADGVSIVGIQLGLITTIRKPNSAGVWCVSLRRNSRLCCVCPRHVSVEKYSGAVWCVTVPNGLVVTRRNGKVAITGNSLKEASAPFVKYAEAYQTYLGSVFARVAWKAIEVAVDAGRLPEEALTLLDLQIEGPTVYQRDRLQVAQEAQIYNALGSLSPQTIAMERGDDYEIEAANIQAHRDRFGDPGQPLGLPGADGSMPGMPPLTGGLQDDAGGALHEGRDSRLAAPFASLVEAAGTCKRGETAAKTGCVPATADSPAENGAVPGGGLSPEEDYAKNGTESKAFKQWFGDSKVVGEDGKPAVVYHGTRGEFDEFRTGTKNAWSDSLGVDTYFFSQDKATASTYANQWKDGKILETYLKIERPLEIDARGGEWVDAIGEAQDKLRTYRTPEEKHFLDLKSQFEEKYRYELEYEPDSIPDEEVRKIDKASRAVDSHIMANKQLYANAKRQPYGYDGIIVKNVLDMTAAGVSDSIDSYNPFTTVHIAFRPDQIKSVQNKGTFNPKSNKLHESALEAAGTCQSGQTAARTGCVPATGGTGTGQPPASKPAAREQAKELYKSVHRATDGEDTRDYYKNLLHDAPAREKLTALADDAETKLRKVSVPQAEKAAAFQTLANESRRIVSRMHRWQRGTGLPSSQSGLVVQMQMLRDGARLAEKKAEAIRAFGQGRRAGESVEEAAQECDRPDCTGADCDKPLLEQPGVLDVPDERQDTAYSCGAACVVSVCKFFGVEPDTEGDAIRQLGSSPRDGTDPERIVTVLEDHGLSTTALAGMDLDAVEWFVSRGRPVICCIQAWEDAEPVAMEAAGTCKPGETAAKTGCVPASGGEKPAADIDGPPVVSTIVDKGRGATMDDAEVAAKWKDLDPNAAKNAHLSDRSKAAIARYYARQQERGAVRVTGAVDLRYVHTELKREGVDPLNASLASAKARALEMPRLADWIDKNPDTWQRAMTRGYYSNLKPGVVPHSGDD